METTKEIDTTTTEYKHGNCPENETMQNASQRTKRSQTNLDVNGILGQQRLRQQLTKATDIRAESA